jgi:hypothetical protein
MAKKGSDKTPQPLAREVMFRVEYDRKQNKTKIVADFGGIQWIAGPWHGDYRGKEGTLWNKYRDKFRGPMEDLRDKLPTVKIT